VAVNMISGNDSKMSYLLNKYLRQEVIYAPCSQGQLPAADTLKSLGKKINQTVFGFGY